MTERLRLPSGTTALLATPSAGAARRGVVVAPDIGGLRPLFEELCQQLADAHGWSVCAPEPWPGREGLELEERLAAVGTLRDDEVLGDLVAAADASGCEPVGLIGFCMGGMYALKAASRERFDRIVSFYGMIRMPEQWRSETQSEPLDALSAAVAPSVMAVVGTADVWTPPADVDELESRGVEVVRYAGAEHGFVHDASRPAHRADYAADAWRRTVTWLDG